MNLFPDDHRSVYSMGRTVSRLRDFDDFSMDSPYSGRRPSSHTAFVPQPSSPGSIESSPRRTLYGEHHLPNFHHDHLHHQEHDQLGVNTLQPNTQRRERAREALIRRNQCDFNISVDSAATNSISSMTGTTEMRTDQTVLQNFPGRTEAQGNISEIRSDQSLNSNISDKSEDRNSVEHLSSEDNLSHDSYDLIDKEEEAQVNTYSENMKTVLSRSELSFDNSLSYSLPVSVPHTPNRAQVHVENYSSNNEKREDINSNSNTKGKINSNSSTQSSRLSINSSMMSTSPLADSNHLQEPTATLSRRRSSGSCSQKSNKSSKGSKNDNSPRNGSKVNLKENAEDSNCFEGHEIHMEEANSQQHGPSFYQRNRCKQEVIRNVGKVRNECRDSGMHEGLIFQSPTNLKYFSPHINPLTFSSKTLPGRKRRDQSPVIFTRGKLSADCSSNSSSSHASPRLSRPKSLDFAMVAFHDLPRRTAYSYRDDTIEQPDFDDSSSALSVQNELNYASSSDVPQTPENSELPNVGGLNRTFINSKSVYSPRQNMKEERIYDIPEGIERDFSPSYENKNVMNTATFKSYLAISGKVSSEDSESVSNRQIFKVLPPARVLKKFSSTESESAPSINSVPAAVQFDSDSLSLPLDLLSPPMESESSTALVESESLPAPPQFGSNKDDTDIDEDVTPKGEDLTPDSLDVCSDTNTMKKKKKMDLPSDEPVLNRPKRQESTYETRAEAILESQLTVESFNGDLAPMVPQVESEDYVPSTTRRRESVLLRALDTFDTFSFEHEFPVTRRQESTYEDRAEAMLEKQLTVDSFTSQNSMDDNVFADHHAPLLFESQDSALGASRETVLESQSTFESYTTECEVLVTKREESTYEARAEAMLESQNTIDSFTVEVPNEEIDADYFDNNDQPDLSDDLQTQLQAANSKEMIMADLYVRQNGGNVHSFPDSVEDEVFESEDANNECRCNDVHCYKNMYPQQMHNAENVYIPSEQNSFDCPPPFDLGLDDKPSCIPREYLDFPGDPFDMDEPPPPFPPEDFVPYVIQNQAPLLFREGFHGSFGQRTLSRISEKSSNESVSQHSDVPPPVFNDNTSVSDQEEPNYTTSEDNDNAPSISSDLPENMAHPLENQFNPSFDDMKVEYQEGDSSTHESLKVTEYTQVDQDTLEEEDLDDTNADEIKTEERISPPMDLPPDVTTSISSENEVCNKDSEGSLHDSMEILEDINTADHFDHDPKQFEVAEFDKAGKAEELGSFLSDVSEDGRYVVTEGSDELMF